MEVKAVFHESFDKDKFLVCKGAQREFRFKESCLINVTATPDPRSYTLAQAEEFVLCPACIQFEPVSPHDVSFYRDEDAMTLLTILGGPIELLNFTEQSLLVTWLKREDYIRRAAIIPSHLYDKISFNIETSVNDMSDLITLHFKQHKNHSIFKESLYLVSLDLKDKHKLVWLRKKLPGMCHFILF